MNFAFRKEPPINPPTPKIIFDTDIGWDCDDAGALSYELHNGGAGRSSWDHTAVLEAVRPGAYWSYCPLGQVSVSAEGITSHRIDGAGKQTFLLPKVDYQPVADIIDRIVGTPKQ